MKANKTTIILAAIMIAAVVSVIAIGVVERRISSQGRVKAINVEVFSDPECTQVLTEIYWGMIEPSETVSTEIYLKNTGNSPLTVSMSTSTWSPLTAENYISVNWDAEGKEINPSDFLRANITLSVSSSISGISSFSFLIIITGSG